MGTQGGVLFRGLGPEQGVGLLVVGAAGQEEPVDAGAGRATIEQGLSELNLTRRAGLEPAGIPRYSTTIEGPGLRIEQVWDETTPWPLFIQTDTSRAWLVAFTKGKS